MIDDSLRRRYLLGEASDEECAAIEQAFMRDLEEQDRVAAAEEILIEDHIDGTLDEHERQRFESYYLATPQHRERVRTTRLLLAAAGPSAFAVNAGKAAKPNSTVSPTSRTWFAAAAALLLVVAGTTWILNTRQTARDGAAVTSAPPPPVVSAPSGTPAGSPDVAPPRVFVILLAASGVRSADNGPPVVIPENTDIVTLRLAAEGERRGVKALVAVVRRVGGGEIWRRPATPDADSGVLARVDVPAARLPADDYIVELLDTTSTQSTQELSRYFLRIRTR